MDKVYRRKVSYVEVIEENGRTVTHMFMDDMGKFSKKKNFKTTTRNYNGMVITTVVPVKE